MLKNILNLDGAQQLSKNEQKKINGSGRMEPGGCSIFVCTTMSFSQCNALNGVIIKGKCCHTYSIC
jgi:hypothetical protein